MVPRRELGQAAWLPGPFVVLLTMVVGAPTAAAGKFVFDVREQAKISSWDGVVAYSVQDTRSDRYRLAYRTSYGVEQISTTGAKDAQEALRRRAVKLVVQEGWSYVAAAEALGVTDRAVGIWVRRFRADGPGSLAKRRRGRRAGQQRALTSAQQQQAAELIAGKCPEQLRIPGLLWTRSAVRALIEQRFGVALEITRSGATSRPGASP